VGRVLLFFPIEFYSINSPLVNLTFIMLYFASGYCLSEWLPGFPRSCNRTKAKRYCACPVLWCGLYTWSLFAFFVKDLGKPLLLLDKVNWPMQGINDDINSLWLAKVSWCIYIYYIGYYASKLCGAHTLFLLLNYFCSCTKIVQCKVVTPVWLLASSQKY
jgi:hypothetical protein